MANISNLKINERSNVERPNSYESLQYKMIIVEIHLYQRANMRIVKIACSAKYRMNEQFQNFLIFGISIVFQIEKILKMC